VNVMNAVNESGEYWMGLSDKEKMNEWKWELSDKKQILTKDAFKNWKVRMSLKSSVRNCALINEMGVWRIERCSSRQKFICKKQPIILKPGKEILPPKDMTWIIWVLIPVFLVAVVAGIVTGICCKKCKDARLDRIYVEKQGKEKKDFNQIKKKKTIKLDGKAFTKNKDNLMAEIKPRRQTGHPTLQGAVNKALKKRVEMETMQTTERVET